MCCAVWLIFMKEIVVDLPQSQYYSMYACCLAARYKFD